MIGGGGIQMEALNNFTKKEYALIVAVEANSKNCSPKEIKAKNVFDLAKKFQVLIFVDGTKSVNRDPQECAWTESNAPIIACMMDDSLSLKFSELTEDKDFVKFVSHKYKDENPKATEAEVKSEVEALHKFLRSLNPKTSKPAKVN